MDSPHTLRLLRRLVFAFCFVPGPHAYAATQGPDVPELTRASPSLVVPFVAVGSPRATKGPLFGNSVYNPQPCPVVESGMAR